MKSYSEEFNDYCMEISKALDESFLFTTEISPREICQTAVAYYEQQYEAYIAAELIANEYRLTRKGLIH